MGLFLAGRMPSCLQSPGGKGRPNQTPSHSWGRRRPSCPGGSLPLRGDPRPLSLSPSSSAYGGKLWPFIHARRAGKGTGSKGHSSPIRGGEKKEKQAKQHFDPLPPCPCAAPCKALGEVERSKKHWQEFDSSGWGGSGGTVGAGK